MGSIKGDRIMENANVQNVTQIGVDTKKTKKKLWTIIIVIVVVLGVVAVALVCLYRPWAKNESYEKVIENLEARYSDRANLSTKEEWALRLNGFLKAEVTDIIDILERSQKYREKENTNKSSALQTVEELENEYGDDYKYTITVKQEEKLTDDQLEGMRSILAAIGKYYVDASQGYRMPDFEKLGTRLGLSMEDTKKYVQALGVLGEKCLSGQVTEGYQLKVTQTITGNKMTKTFEEYTMNVYKIEGCWVWDMEIRLLEFLFEGK